MYLLLLAGFSNYNNRTIRKAATPDDYAYSSTGHWYITEDKAPYGLLSVNFKPNDGVSTTQIINNWLSSEYGHEPDYLIAFDNKDTSTECIVSRWYILEIRQTRGGQKELVLRRDLIADYYEQLKTADVFVERGLCPDNDPLVFNDEGLNLNKIKKSEVLLKDKTRIPWLVGYFASDISQESITIPAESVSDYLTTAQAATIIGITQQQMEDILNGTQMNVADNWTVTYKTDRPNFEVCLLGSDLTTFNKGILTSGSIGMTLKRLFNTSIYLRDFPYLTNEAIVSNASSVLSQFKTIPVSKDGAPSIYITMTKSQIEAIQNLPKAILFNGKYLRVKEVNFGGIIGYRSQKMTISGALKTALEHLPAFMDDGEWVLSVGANAATFVVENDSYLSVSGKFGGSGVKELKNRPYKMFCIPAGKYSIIYNDDPEDSTPLIYDFDGSGYAIRLAKQLLLGLGDKIYDLQLLPYCPIRSRINPNFRSREYISLDGMTNHQDYEEYVDGSNNSVIQLFYCDSDSDSFVINDNTAKFNVDTSNKYDSNAKMLRLCSPNYQGSFDFNSAKNYGVFSWNVNFTYKPYSPFLRVAPSFGGLYGGEFRDQRGLICGGNFSLTRVSDAWQQYEMNNKNYQNIFNREIQSLDLKQSFEMRDQILNSVAGTIQGAATGAQIGSSFGAVGAVIGAAAGGSLSAAAGIADVASLAVMQKDARSLQVDRYNYALGNIKALPNTLTKVDAFDASSKIWPFVEEYGPTDEEKNLFEEKIRLQSYTIMRIEKLENQMTEVENGPANVSDLHFVKGQLIRTDNDDLCVDSHQWDELYAELSKGVYI